MRRLRGLLGTALLWAVVWPLALSPWLAYRWAQLRSTYSWGCIRSTYVEPPLPLHILAEAILSTAAWGAFSGAVFGLIVIAAGRRSGGGSVERLGVRRPAGWGLLAGLAAPLLLGLTWLLNGEYTSAAWLTVALVSAALGGAIAAGSVCLAARRPAHGSGAPGGDPSPGLRAVHYGS